MNNLVLAQHLLGNIDQIWTFFLLLTRFVALFMSIPGLSFGAGGLALRYPAILVLTLACLPTTPVVPMANDWAMAGAMTLSELIFGGTIGLLGKLIIAGVQVGTELAVGMMGLSAGQLIDPTTGATLSTLSRIQADVMTIMFLLLGGHHVMVYTAAGLSGQIQPGSFVINQISISLLIDRTAHIFQMGIMVAAPVIMALLLTQFVMGLLSKAVPQINVFIVSFPLTIGIGLILVVIGLPELVTFVRHEISGLDTSLTALLSAAKRLPSS